MLKLRLQYFGRLRRRAESLAKTLMLRKIAGRRGRGQQRMRWLDGITDSIDMSLSKLREVLRTRKLEFCNPWGRKESDMTWQLNNNNRLILQIIYLGLWKKLERLRGAGYRDKRIFRGGFRMLPILFPHADEVEGRLLCFMSSKMHFKGIHYFPVAGETWLTDVWYVLEAPKSKILSFDVPALMVGQRMTQESSGDQM